MLHTGSQYRPESCTGIWSPVVRTSASGAGNYNLFYSFNNLIKYWSCKPKIRLALFKLHRKGDTFSLTPKINILNKLFPEIKSREDPELFL